MLVKGKIPQAGRIPPHWGSDKTHSTWCQSLWRTIIPLLQQLHDHILAAVNSDVAWLVVINTTSSDSPHAECQFTWQELQNWNTLSFPLLSSCYLDHWLMHLLPILIQFSQHCRILRNPWSRILPAQVLMSVLTCSSTRYDLIPLSLFHCILFCK